MAWPATPEGVPLTLAMSIPTEFLNEHAGFALLEAHFVSVFTYYSASDYFLDCITYHGNAEELEVLRQGYTRVVLHREGCRIEGPVTVPAMRIETIGAYTMGQDFQKPKIGGKMDMLQEEFLKLDDQRFALQLYGDDFPEPFRDIVYMPGALAYLFIKPSLVAAEGPTEAGTFFIQVT